MSNYNIGQFRYKKGMTFTTPIDLIETDIGYEDKGGKVFEQMIKKDFTGLETFYMQVSLASLGKNVKQLFTIKLKNENSDRVQIIKTFDLDNGEAEENSEHIIEFVFTPKTNFTHMIFELQRTVEDDYNQENPRKMSFTKLPSLLSVKNVLIEILGENPVIKKLGIQGPTDLIFYVNGEPMILGQSQMFEIYRPDFNIYSVGFVISETASNINHIMDYCY